MGLVIGGNIALGQLHIVGPATSAERTWQLAAVGLAGALCTGFAEELLFRGYLLQAFGEVAPVWLATVTCSLLFALTHAGSAGVPDLVDILLAGVLLCLARLVSGSLWLGIGFHAAWNFVEDSLGGNTALLHTEGPAVAHLEGSLEASGTGFVIVILLALVLLGKSLVGETRMGWRRKLQRDGTPVAL
jgi:membrane protease YdiL (CAAX protease family)